MRYAALLLILAALFVGACSGGDDDDDNGGSNDTTASASSDDGSSSDDSSASSDDSSSNDEDSGDQDSGNGEISGKEDEYAADICTALDNFTTNFPTLMNPSALASGDFSDLVDAFRALGDDLDKADPPDFMEEYHNALVEYVYAQADAWESGDEADLARLEELANFPEPSEAELEQFARSAQNYEQCGRVGLAPAG